MNFMLLKRRSKRVYQAPWNQEGAGPWALEEEQSFGELALLYNTRRAASIVANNDVTLWFISRDIFRNITTYFKHQRLLKFETFLKQVDLFKDMSRRALFRVAEALEEEEHEAEDKIIIQGDQGNHFYIVEEGR